MSQGKPNDVAPEELELDEGNALAHQAVDYGISGSILGILALTALYAFFPVDTLPNAANDPDDYAVIAAGVGAVLFLTIMRFVLLSMMTHRLWRWGCLVLVMLVSTAAFAVFWILLHFFNSVFSAL